MLLLLLLLLALLLLGGSELTPQHCLPLVPSRLSAALALPAGGRKGGCAPALFSSSDSVWPFVLLSSSCPAWCLCPGSLMSPAALILPQWAWGYQDRPTSHRASFILAVALGSLGGINGLSVCLWGPCWPVLCPHVFKKTFYFVL